VGLLTGFEPFAGLPSNPAAMVLPLLRGERFGGLRLVAEEMPVSLSRAPARMAALLEAHRPVFVLALGLAAGAATVRAETIAVNAAHLAVPDNDGSAPLGGMPLAAGPAARMATWNAAAVVEAVEAEGVPARLSFHAGTHLCNALLYSTLAALENSAQPVPCGFLHLPYLPEQVVWLRRQAAIHAAAGAWEQPSMALDLQVRAVRATLGVMAAQAAGEGVITLA
jgi:pyroglutamyl-peptidase